jgi:hypothetical protein
MRTVNSRLQVARFYILRNVDSATASFSSFLSNSSASGQWKSGWVMLEVHKAGGKNLAGAIKPQPLIKFVLDDAACVFQGFFTHGDTGMPMEILGFQFSSAEISTAEQNTSGLLGKVRVCKIGAIKRE